MIENKVKCLGRTDESNFIFLRYVQHSKVSDINNNLGQLPLQPRYTNFFANKLTGEIVSSTDLDRKKRSRNKHYMAFKANYNNSKAYVLSIVASVESYSSITKLMDTINKKLKRNDFVNLGYVWCRDMGKNIYGRHFHILVATSIDNDAMFEEIFSGNVNGKKVKYGVEKDKGGMLDYIKKKELYAGINQRSFGRSRVFKKYTSKLRPIEKLPQTSVTEK